MFGKKQNQKKTTILPVLTMDTLPRNFETVGQVVSEYIKGFVPKVAMERINKDLSRQGTKLGADAIIGIKFINIGGLTGTIVIGTAIKYLD